MNLTLRAWRASFTRRWHQNYDLCDTLDYDAGHQGRVALLILSLNPDASRALLAWAIVHDQGEALAGDVSCVIKQADPELADRHKALEDREISNQGFRLPGLTHRESGLLKLCDRLDGWLWMMRHKRSLYARADWQRALAGIEQLAHAAGLYEEVMELVAAEVTS